MNVPITIPDLKKIAQGKGFVLIPQKEYKSFLRMKARTISEIKLTSRQKRAITASEKELANKEYVSLDEL